MSAYNNLRGNIKALGRTSMQGDSTLLALERSINARLSSAVTLPAPRTCAARWRSPPSRWPRPARLPPGSAASPYPSF